MGEFPPTLFISFPASHFLTFPSSPLSRLLRVAAVTSRQKSKWEKSFIMRNQICYSSKAVDISSRYWGYSNIARVIIGGNGGNLMAHKNRGIFAGGLFIKVRIKLQQWEFVQTYFPLHIREHSIHRKILFSLLHSTSSRPTLYPSYLNEIGVIWKRRRGGRGRTAIAAIAETRLQQCLPSPYPETASYTTHGSPQGTRLSFFSFLFFGDVRKWMLPSWLFSFPESPISLSGMPQSHVQFCPRSKRELEETSSQLAQLKQSRNLLKEVNSGFYLRR